MESIVQKAEGQSRAQMQSVLVQKVETQPLQSSLVHQTVKEQSKLARETNLLIDQQNIGSLGMKEISLVRKAEGVMAQDAHRPHLSLVRKAEDVMAQGAHRLNLSLVGKAEDVMLHLLHKSLVGKAVDVMLHGIHLLHKSLVGKAEVVMLWMPHLVQKAKHETLLRHRHVAKVNIHRLHQYLAQRATAQHRQVVKVKVQRV